MQVKWENKKKEKVERSWKRRINLTKATFLATSAASDALLFSVTGDDSLSIIDIDALLFPIASGSLFHFAVGGSSSAVFSIAAPLSPVAGGFLSSITTDGFLSPIADHSLSTALGNYI